MANLYESERHPASDDSMMSDEPQALQLRRVSGGSNGMRSFLYLSHHTDIVNIVSMASRRSELSSEQVLRDTLAAREKSFNELTDRYLILSQQVADADKRAAVAEVQRDAAEVRRTDAEERARTAEERARNAEEHARNAERRTTTLVNGLLAHLGTYQ